ncbi:hypothetical protein O3P69_020961 [Scylla paramamosain]|uniref:Uncharacterized protein n=1 Tax=Scylla paramamosain TaxID=85552 RepID=A0AAW0SG73_SCYPA
MPYWAITSKPEVERIFKLILGEYTIASSDNTGIDVAKNKFLVSSVLNVLDLEMSEIVKNIEGSIERKRLEQAVNEIKRNIMTSSSPSILGIEGALSSMLSAHDMRDGRLSGSIMESGEDAIRAIDSFKTAPLLVRHTALFHPHSPLCLSRQTKDMLARRTHSTTTASNILSESMPLLGDIVLCNTKDTPPERAIDRMLLSTFLDYRRRHRQEDVSTSTNTWGGADGLLQVRLLPSFLIFNPTGAASVNGVPITREGELLAAMKRKKAAGVGEGNAEEFGRGILNEGALRAVNDKAISSELKLLKESWDRIVKLQAVFSKTADFIYKSINNKIIKNQMSLGCLIAVNSRGIEELRITMEEQITLSSNQGREMPEHGGIRYDSGEGLITDADSLFRGLNSKTASTNLLHRVVDTIVQGLENGDRRRLAFVDVAPAP